MHRSGPRCPPRIAHVPARHRAECCLQGASYSGETRARANRRVSPPRAKAVARTGVSISRTRASPRGTGHKGRPKRRYVPPSRLPAATNVQPVASSISAWLQSGARPTTHEGSDQPHEQEHYSTSPMAACLASLDRCRGRDRGFTGVGGSYGFSGGMRLHLFRRRRRHRWRELGRQGSRFPPQGAVDRVPWLDLHQPRQRDGRPYLGQGHGQTARASGGITPQGVLVGHYDGVVADFFGTDDACSGVCG